MKTEDQKSYPKIRDAFHLGFNYTIEGLRQCFCESVPDKKQTFLEDSSHLQRLFDHWIKSSNIEQSYSSLWELIIIRKILDSVDKPLYSFIIEQNLLLLTLLSKFLLISVKIANAFLFPNYNKLLPELLVHNFQLKQINHSLINIRSLNH